MEFKWLNEGEIAKMIKVNLLTQAPVGSGGTRVYEDLIIEKTTIKNIRWGK